MYLFWCLGWVLWPESNSTGFSDKVEHHDFLWQKFYLMKEWTMGTHYFQFSTNWSWFDFIFTFFSFCAPSLFFSFSFSFHSFEGMYFHSLDESFDLSSFPLKKKKKNYLRKKIVLEQVRRQWKIVKHKIHYQWQLWMSQMWWNPEGEKIHY